jgi:1-acyl-sn-glycerol-3-phosphate acyltransferase
VSQGKLLRERRFGPFFLAQFTGAFNDNAFKQAIVIFIAMTFGAAEAESDTLLAGALFIAPYFLFSATAGQLAEKYDKALIVRATKLLEIGIMVLAAIAFALHHEVLLLSLLALLGLQATLFGPAKYAILPQVLREDELVGGNGMIEMGTYVAILGGSIVGAEVVALPGGTTWIAIVLIACASIGYLGARMVPSVPSSVPDLRINPNVFAETLRTIRFSMETKSVWLSILGISWFWLYGALFLSELPTFVATVLGGETSVFTLCLVFFSMGVGTGSLLCERLSSGHIELGLVPFGSIGLSLFGIDLFFASEWHMAAGDALSPLQILADPSHYRILFDLTMIGVFGGLYSVPLYALIQHRSDPTKRSRIIAGNNIINSIFIVGAAALAFFCRSTLGLSIPAVFLVGAVLNALVAIYIYTLLPEFLLRFVVWILMHTMYRLREVGLSNLPDEGAALLVCNHVSFVDSLILAAASRRPIRFVMYWRIYDAPGLHWLFKTAKAIPIAGRKENPALMEKAFADVKRALDEGELVGIFPEGMITYTGEINSFRPGVERILAANPVPVIPSALRGLWGSFFSRRGGPAMQKVPRRFWSKVELEVGAPIPASEATAARLEQEVRALRGDWK